MIQRSIKRLTFRALMVDDELTSPTAEGRAARALVVELQARGIEVVEAGSAEDGHSVIVSDSAIHVILVDWTLGDDKDHAKARGLIQAIRSRNDKIPIFLMAERGEASSIPIEVMEFVDEFIWTLEDTAAFVGGRVVAATRRYLEVMMPPLAAALMKFSQEYRVLLAHAGPRRRHGVPQVAGGPDLLRLLRREPPPVRSLGQRGHARLAPRSHRSDGRARALCRPGVRRSPHVLRDQRHVHVEPRDLHGRRGARSDRTLRSELPQVDRAQPGDDGGHPDLLRAPAQSLWDHRPDPPGSAEQEGHRRRDEGKRARGEGHRSAGRLLRRDQLHLRRALLQRPTRRGAARPECRPDPLRRSVVRLRPVQPDLPRPPRHARRSQGPHRARRSLPRTRPTSCWPPSRRRPSSTSGTDAARFRMRDSTSRSCCTRRRRRSTPSSCRTTSRRP